jgi:hypothetical protein
MLSSTYTVKHQTGAVEDDARSIGLRYAEFLSDLPRFAGSTPRIERASGLFRIAAAVVAPCSVKVGGK